MTLVFESKAEGAHALLSASAAHRWATCAPSLRLHNAVPSRSSKSADKGTVLHEVAAWRLLNDDTPYPHTSVTVNGVEWPLTKDMLEAAGKYVAKVRELAEGGTLLVEQQVNYARWLGVDEDRAWGTSDAIVVFSNKILGIDAKFGENPNNRVDAADEDGKPNDQGVCYLLGAAYEYEHLGPFETAEFVIVQPYLDHVSSYEMTFDELKAHAERLKVGAEKALRYYENVDEPPLEAYRPTEKGCQWCAAKHSCPALAAEVEEETRDLFSALVEHGGEAMAAAVPEDRLAQAMSKIGLIEDFCKAIRSEVERRLLAGHKVPGFKLIEGRAGPRSWVDEVKAEKDLRRVLGAKDALQIKPISPTAAEKFHKQGLLSQRIWDNLCKNVERSDGKPSVAPESHKSPAINVVSVDEKFAQLTADSLEDLV